MKNVIDYNSIDNNENKNANTRWAYTALSYEHREYAVNDEILIDKQTGKFYYKRPDGVIVESESSKSSFQIIQEISNVIHQVENDGTFEFPTSTNSILVSATYPLSSRVDNLNLIKDIGIIKDFEFFITKESNGFFVKVISREMDKNFIELLTQMYNDKYSNANKNNCTMGYKIQLTMNDGSTMESYKTSDVKMNTVSFVTLDKSELVKDTTYTVDDISTITIKVTNISSHKIKGMIDDERLQTEPYSSIVSDDKQIQITDILIHSFVDTIEELPQYSDIRIESISSSITVKDIADSSGGMSKEDKKKFEDLIAKVNAMPVVYMQETEPENWKAGDMWYKLYDIIGNTGPSEHASNLMVKNATFNKDELEKFLISNDTVLTDKEMDTYYTFDENDSGGVLLKLI